LQKGIEEAGASRLFCFLLMKLERETRIRTRGLEALAVTRNDLVHSAAFATESR
jgi:hypothetical protein